jgi:Ca2+-binding RTX toxin-like protein
LEDFSEALANNMYVILRSVRRFFWGAILALAVTSLFSVFAATNTIAESGAGDRSIAITLNDFRPPECTMNVDNLVAGDGNLNGTAGNDLMLGGSVGQMIRGGRGDDCLLAGAGDDQLSGNQGNDILLAGVGEDNLRGNQDYDLCYGGNDSDADSANNTCEEQYQIP